MNLFCDQGKGLIQDLKFRQIEKDSRNWLNVLQLHNPCPCEGKGENNLHKNRRGLENTKLRGTEEKEKQLTKMELFNALGLIGIVSYTYSLIERLTG